MELYYHDLDRNVLVLNADGGLNSETAEQLFAQLEQIIDAGIRRIIVDCSRLEYISSVGIAKLMRLHRKLTSNGGDVRLASVGGPLFHLLEIVHLNRIFGIYPDVDQARLSFRPPATP